MLQNYRIQNTRCCVGPGKGRRARLVPRHHTHQNHKWSCWWVEVQMHELHSDIEFKYVKVRKDGHVGQWERGHNRNFSLENPPAKDVFVDGGQFGDEQPYDTKPVKKSSNLVPGCVARVHSYPKIAALSVEATQSEAEAVAQEPASTEEAEEEEKSGMRCYFCASFS